MVGDDQLKQIRELLRLYAKSPLIRDSVGLALAKEVTEQMTGATDRALRLLGILMAQRLSGRASDYVARVSRLYIQGFEIETGVMCRSALEAALAERLKNLIRYWLGEHRLKPGYEIRPEVDAEFGF
jgi:hypothetical protein